MTDRAFTLVASPVYQSWFSTLRDERVTKAILARLERLRIGNAGDAGPVGEGVSELRIHLGAGWRVYYLQRGGAIILLLGGGSKRTQRSDIRSVIEQVRALKENG